MHGPATDETGLHVIKLVGVLYVLIIIFDVMLAWHIDAIDIGNHFVLTLFISLLVAITGCILAISRQPQIRYAIHSFTTTRTEAAVLALFSFYISDLGSRPRKCMLIP